MESVSMYRTRCAGVQPVMIQFDARVDGGEGGYEDVGVGTQFADFVFK